LKKITLKKLLYKKVDCPNDNLKNTTIKILIIS
jgi:hypothetical protein